MADRTKFKIREISDLTGFDNSDSTYYRKKTELNFKIKIPIGLKSIYITFLTWSKSSDPYDMYQFSISRFYKKKNSERTHVVIYCNDRKSGETTRFECYSSISDGSFWRFCVKDDMIERYDKGYNYITTTFINIYLQKFIDEVKDNFDVQIESELDSTIKCVKTSDMDPYLKDRIEKFTYCDLNKFFIIIDTFFPPVDYISNFKNHVIKLLNYLIKQIDKNNFEEHVDIASDLFCFLNKNGVGRGIELSDISSRRQFFGNVKNAFEELFLKYFIINRYTKKIIYNKSFKIGLYDFNGTIYSIEIDYKKNSKKYILYYMEYFSTTRKTFKDLIKTIIYIEPVLKSDDKPNEITKYGLDEIYVVAGAFVNKIFDYQSQANITVLKGHIEKDSQEYRYIGDLNNYSFLP